MRGWIHELSPEGLGYYHFVDPDLEAEIFFEKERATK